MNREIIREARRAIAASEYDSEALALVLRWTERRGGLWCEGYSLRLIIEVCRVEGVEKWRLVDAKRIASKALRWLATQI